MTTAEEKEILSLLCKVHELEIDKVRWKILWELFDCQKFKTGQQIS